MSILIVSGIEGATGLAAAIEKQLGTEVKVAQGRRTALSALRAREFAVVVVDESLVECDPEGADLLWEKAGLAVPLQVNFATSGAVRLIREIRAAMRRRERERNVAHRAAIMAVESDMRSTIAGLLLHSQLALLEDKIPGPAADKLRIVARLVTNLRDRLDKPGQISGHPAA
ncbi:MAG TPA: hypothetical protein VK716_06435 [Terracidiphilus sp.]|nr:hypothetical protein [Terracidiphilus sp.]